jgi:hypothetical protein
MATMSALQVELEHDRDGVAGAPLYAALTVRATDPQLVLTVLPEVSPYSAMGAAGVTLARDGAEVFRSEPLLLSADEIESWSFALDRGEERRMLFDLSETLGTKRLAPASYTLTVRYAALDRIVESAPSVLVLRDPAPAHAAALARAAEERGKRSWGWWTHVMPAAGEAMATFDPDDPLCFNRIVRALRAGGSGLAVIPALRSLSGVLESEAAALIAEILRAAGDPAEYEAQRAFVLRRWPGLRWWIRAIDEGGGTLYCANVMRL